MEDWSKWAEELQGLYIPPEELRRIIGLRESLALSLGRLPTSTELAEVAAVAPDVAAESLRWNAHVGDVTQFDGLPEDE